MATKITPELKKKLRAMWSPQRKERADQCASCPFKEGNDEEWKAVLESLAESDGMDLGDVDPDGARAMIHAEVSERGDFSCHQTAYDVDGDMERRDLRKLLQCPGASKHFRGCK